MDHYTTVIQPYMQQGVPDICWKMLIPVKNGMACCNLVHVRLCYGGLAVWSFNKLLSKFISNYVHSDYTGLVIST
jgi:hypothetical protein